MFEKCQHARTASLFPPYCVDFPCNTQSIAASNRLVWRKNPSLLGKFPIFKQGLISQLWKGVFSMSFDPYEFDRDYSPANRRVVTEGEYTTRTFLWMVLGLMITFGVAVVGWITNLTLYVYVYAPFVQLAVLIVTLVMAYTMSARIEKMSVGTARSIFVAFSALFGFTLS